MAVTIQLTQGYTTTVDDEDAILVLQYKWHAWVSPGKPVYAARSTRPNGRYKRIWMHREIMGAPDDVFVDHADGNGLNNRRNNLRLCTVAENSHNQRRHRKRSRLPKGVWRSGKGWSAAIRTPGTRHYLGTFNTPEEAGLAYDSAANRLHGAFARTNSEAA